METTDAECTRWVRSEETLTRTEPAITQERFPVQTATPNTSRCTLVNATDNLYDCLFDVNRRSNGPGGRNIGFEVQASRALFAGFGAAVNYT